MEFRSSFMCVGVVHSIYTERYTMPSVATGPYMVHNTILTVIGVYHRIGNIAYRGVV